MSTPTQSSAGRPWIVVVIAAVLVVGGLGAYLLRQSMGTALATNSQPTFAVQQGPLTISVVQSGTIKSREQVSLKSEVEGSATIIFLIPEGTQVEEGDLLVELDSSQLEDQLIQQQISVDNADAANVRARENLAVAKNQAESDISKAELDFDFAKQDVTQYNDGTFPQELKEAETNITLTHEEKERAKEELTWSERLFEKKYISQTELDADRLTEKRAELNYELAVAARDLLKEYTYPRRVAELESNVEQMEMALERVKLQANADVVQAEANYKAAQRELEQQQTKLARLQRQLDHTKIYAPRSGLVVYATSMRQGGRRWREEPLEEGQNVRERQELIYLPSAASMMAEVQIHESSLEKVAIGLPVRITVDALPGNMYTGRVAMIAPLPDAQSAWMNPDLKVYPCEIHLEGTHPELRTGMSCQAEIVVEKHADALAVPVQAVIRLGGQPTVFVRGATGFEATPIEIGLDNNSMVHVLSGVTAGQEVLLTPPLDASATDEAAGEEGADADSDFGDAQPAGAGQSGERSGGRGDASRGPQQRGAQQGPSGGDRQRFENMSEEQRNQMRERFRNMTPEEREKLRQQFGGQQGRGSGADQGQGSGGGQRPQSGGQGPRGEGQGPRGDGQRGSEQRPGRPSPDEQGGE